MKILVTILIPLFFLCQQTAIHAQAIMNAHVIGIGSDGTEQVNADNAESCVKDAASVIAGVFRGKLKTNMILLDSKPISPSIPAHFSQYFRSCDSSDFLFSIVVGGWTSNGSSSTLAMKGNESITADYLCNVYQLIPAKNSVLFIIAPQKYAFPEELLGSAEQMKATGGKHIIVVRAGKKMSYTDLLNGFIKTLEASFETPALDRNYDGSITLAEWLSACYEVAPKYGVAFKGSTLVKNPDVQLFYRR
jgi:hypothetical protein